MQNNYLNKVYNEIKAKNNNEPEYLQAVYEFLSSIEKYIDKNPDLEKHSLLERFCEPERLIQFRVSWLDDLGNVCVNRGYRVQFNSAIGPYKGGLRFHPSVNQSILKFLGFEQTLKNSLTGLPIGGAKGGSDFDPKGKSDKEIMRFCQSFMTELYRNIGANTDIPAGDIGVSAKEIGYLFGQYKKITNEFNGAITGKGIAYGGSLGRKEATGYGLCYFANKMLNEMKNTSLKDKKIIISGSGNVALYALEKATSLGAKIIAMSDSNGYIYSSNGINFEYMKEIKELNKGRVKDYLKYDKNAIYCDDHKAIWQIKCDIAMPCATQNEIDLEDAKILVQNGTIAVVEGANMPSTLEATKYFIENEICYAPSKAANAGGVIVSTFEMSQNAMHLNYSFNEVDLKLKEIMENTFTNIYNMAKKYNEPNNLLLGANIIGFEKVSNAMLSQGII